MDEPIAVSPLTYTKQDFSRFFRRKFGVLLRAAFDSSQRRPRYRDPTVIEAIAANYRPLAPDPRPHTIPRHVFMLWQQGWDAAPPVVKACAASWRAHNPGWELRLIDAEEAVRLAPELATFEHLKISRPARSDIVRMALLAAHGGIWADATVFCTRPLDDWLPTAAASGLAIFHEPRPYRYVDVWFMAAAAGNPLIAAWYDMLRQYWELFARPHHYYWLPYLLEYLVSRDESVRAEWLAMPKLSALGPLAVQGNPFDTNAPKAVFDLIAENRVPVHKLSHKWLFNGPLAGTPVGVLTGLEKL